MRVLICGGRDFTDTEFVYKALDRLHKAHGFDVVIEGDARGVDRISGYWARKKRIDNLKFAVNTEKDGAWPAAGARRNARMLKESKPDLVIAFPGGNGTADMVRRALAAGVRVIVVRTEKKHAEHEGAADRR